MVEFYHNLHKLLNHQSILFILFIEK